MTTDHTARIATLDRRIANTPTFRTPFGLPNPTEICWGLIAEREQLADEQTLTDALAELGFGHRPAKHGRDIFDLETGEVAIASASSAEVPPRGRGAAIERRPRDRAGCLVSSPAAARRILAEHCYTAAKKAAREAHVRGRPPDVVRAVRRFHCIDMALAVEVYRDADKPAGGETLNLPSAASLCSRRSCRRLQRCRGLCGAGGAA